MTKKKKFAVRKGPVTPVPSAPALLDYALILIVLPNPNPNKVSPGISRSAWWFDAFRGP
jgi:hypothetical protein